VVGAQALGDEAEEGLADLQGGREGGREEGVSQSTTPKKKGQRREGGRGEVSRKWWEPRHLAMRRKRVLWICRGGREGGREGRWG